MRKLGAGIISLLCLVAAAGCTTNKSIANVTFSTQATLEFALGTLNDGGAVSFLNTGAAAPATYLNVVTSFRNQNGVSAYINPGTATLSGTAAVGPFPGSFAYGQAPGDNSVIGLTPAYPPTTSTTFRGFGTGFVFTGVTPPAAGPYTLADNVPVNGSTTSYSATSTLSTITTLGAETPPAFVSDGTGGGTFTVTVPAGVTETFVAVYDDVSVPPAPACSSIGPQEVLLQASGTTATLPDVLVVGNPYCDFVFGADYPLLESGPPANLQVSPTLTGTAGTVDLTASAIASFTE
jgi:hypothetical protein